MQYVGLAISIGTTLYSLFSREKPKPIEGPRLGDLSVNSSARGAPLPRVWGSMRVTGNVIDGRKFEVKTEEEIGGGGKGGLFGGSEQTQITYSYYGDFAISLCEGPITAVRRIWLNNKLWYDVSDTATETALTLSAEHKKFFKLYTGSATQNPDPTLEAIHGAGNVPPYRHTAYLVFAALPLDVFGNAIPQVSVEVVISTASYGAITALPQSAGQYTTNAVQDPLTGRIFILENGAGVVDVYDSGLTLIKQIALPSGTSGGGTHPGNTPCYVSSTREIWVPYSTPNDVGNPYFWSGVAVIDPDALVLKTSFLVDMTGIGPSMYNPFLDHVLLWEFGLNGRVMVFTAGPVITGIYDNVYWPANPRFTIIIPQGLAGHVLMLEPHGLFAFAGAVGAAGNWLELWSALTYAKLYSFTGSGFTGNNCIAYDSIRQRLYWANTAVTTFYIIDLSGGGATVTTTVLPFRPSSGMTYLPAIDRIVIYDSAPVGKPLYVLFPDSLTVDFQRDGIAFGAFITPINGTSFVLLGDEKYKVPLVATQTQQGVLLSQIVTDLCAEVGLTGADINVSQLSDTVPGYIRAEPTEAAAIGPLMTCYLFDGVESDYILKFPKRGGSSIATLTEDKLAAHAYGESGPDPITIARVQEVELPNAVSVHYMALKYDYQPGTQIKKRTIGRSVNTTTVELPIALSNPSARRLANVLMDNAWTERTRYDCALAIDSIALDPADIITVNLDDGSSHVIRLVKVDFGTPSLLRLEGVAEDAANYTSDAEAQDDSIATQPFVPIGNTRLVLLDAPILQDSDNNAGFYYAIAGYQTGWDGAMLYKSIDGGGTYGALDAMVNAAAIGTASTALPTGPATIWDNGSTVTVFLTQGTLASDTEANVLAGKNAAFLGAHGRWELIQWQTATLNGDGSYTLSKLLRGRKGTEHALASHAIGDTFVALTRTTIDRAAMATSEIGLLRHFKGVSVGQNLQDAARQAFTNNAVGLECYSPVNIKGTRVASGDLTITWIRRTRADGEWRDAVDVVLFEDLERYDLEILNGSTVVRTWTDLTSASQVYTSAQQVTDFGSNQAAVSVKAYQKSSIVARGYPGSATV